MSPENKSGEENAPWFHRDRGGQVPQQDAEKREESSLSSGLWRKCDGCAEFLKTDELVALGLVCPFCCHHHRISGMDRLEYLVDDGSFEERDTEISSMDPLQFVDSKAYEDRLVGACEKTGRNSAFAFGRATIEARPLYIGTFLFAFMGGSMGSVVGEKITRMFESALADELPVVLINASGGARMQEGVLSLMQMARTTAALGRLRDAGLPYISVLTHPTTGGVAASFAMLGDLILAEPRALIGFAGPRVIEQTIRQILPEGFQRSEFLMDHGMIDQVVDRRELRPRIAALLGLLRD